MDSLETENRDDSGSSGLGSSFLFLSAIEHMFKLTGKSGGICLENRTQGDGSIVHFSG